MPDDLLTRVLAALGDHGPDAARTEPDVPAAVGILRHAQRTPGGPRPVNDQPTGEITLTPGVSHFDHAGYVSVRWGLLTGQLQISEARRFGQEVFAAAEAAEMDAAMFAFAKERLEADDKGAAAILAALREYREKAGR